jgi:plastocyanin
MSHRSLAALAMSALILLAGCGSSSSSSAPASVAASAPASAAASGAASACKETTTAGTVPVSIVDFAFQPTAITAKVGDVVGFTNTGATAHTATLDDGTCTTPTIAPTKSDGLTFTVAGTYKFHCSIHSQMTGTIVVS